MKAYLVTTCTIFGLVVLAHVLRVFAEGSHLLREPAWVLLTVAAGAMCVWSWLLLRRTLRHDGH